MRKNYKKRKIGKVINKKQDFNSSIINEIKILVLILIVILSILIVSLINQVMLLKPGQNQVIYDRYPEFSWISRYENYEFYLSKDEDFSSLISQEKVSGNKLIINRSLYFGDYYWKVIAISKERRISSPVSSFKIESLVASEINETFRNAGNTRIDVDIIEDNGITGSTILEIDEEIPISNNKTLYQIKQNE